MTRKQLIKNLVNRRAGYRRTAATGRYYETRLRAAGKLQLATALLRQLGARECRREANKHTEAT